MLHALFPLAGANIDGVTGVVWPSPHRNQNLLPEGGRAVIPCRDGAISLSVRERLNLGICEFWSSVALMSGRYHGQPMEKHVRLPVDARHFDRWLQLFERTALEVCPPAAAAHFIERAKPIAQSLELGIAARLEKHRPDSAERLGLERSTEQPSISQGVQ